MRKENDLESWRLLFMLARLGSVTRVAGELGIEPSSVSRRLSALEAGLGCALLHRTPRSIALSPAGLAAVERLQPLLAQWDTAVTELNQDTHSAAGTIRLSAGLGYGQEMLAPMVIRFRKQFPDIHVELVLSDRPADLSRDNFDVVFRYGPIENEDLVARRLYAVDFFLCASPDYLREQGTPSLPQDLGTHTLLAYGGGRRPATTHLQRGSEQVEISGHRPLRMNSVLAMREAAIAGEGIAIDLPLFSCAQALRRGQLVRVLPEWSAPSRDAYAVRLASRRPPQRLSLFIDWIAAERRRVRQELLATLGEASYKKAANDDGEGVNAKPRRALNRRAAAPAA